MADETRDAGSSSDEYCDQAAQHTLAANPLVGVRGSDILDSARALLGHMMSNPGMAAQQYLSFLAELGRIVTGASELAPDVKDKRFADPAWKESAAYRALAQCYLAWGRALNRFVDEATMDKRDAERARFIASLFMDAMSPTNSLAGNPAAHEEAHRDRRRKPRARPAKFSSAISRATAACRRRSTRASSPWARTWRQLQAR